MSSTEAALDAVRAGRAVSCHEHEYPDVRRALQKYAATMIDQDQIVYAHIALNEVKRLDQKFQFTL